MYEFHLFAGIGGGILGGMLNGNVPIGAVEIEEYPRKILIQRQLDGCLPVFPIWDDVCTFREDNGQCRWFIEYLRSIRDNLRICGGFPCQDISIAGRGKGLEGERSGLWKEFKRILREIRPCQALLENSSMLTVRGGLRVVADLTEMGYDCQWGIISAEDVGAWHKRDRFWLLAERERERERFITPSSTDGIRSRFKMKSYLTIKRLKHSTGSLVEDIVRKMIFPTARVGGMCGGTGSRNMAKRLQKAEFLKSIESSSMQSGNGGQLNPDWVEWLMGLPIGWTALKPLETPKFQSWQLSQKVF